MRFAGGILRFKLILLALSTSASAAAAAVFAVREMWPAAGVSVIIWIICCCILFKFYGKNGKKISYMFDAMDNDDFSFKFDTRNVAGTDLVVNQYLNRIKMILQRYASEAREREKFYETTLDSVDTGIIVVNEKGAVLQKNSKALELTGLNILTHIAQLKRVDSGLASLIAGIAPGERRRITFQTETGSRSLSVAGTSAAIKQEPVRIIALNDIDNELSENELDSWLKLIRVLTHEIMNSITPITSLSGTLLDKVEKDSQVRDGIEVIHKTGCDLISFVENYRKFTHVPTPEPTIFYIKETASRAMALASQQAGAGRISFHLDIEPDDLMVYADEKLISRVLTNLLKNAVQATEDSGKGRNIWISARNGAGDKVIVDVSNDGPEIPDEVAAHIFVPFFTTKKNGSGIGLSLSRQIMRLSGGSLTLRTDKEKGITSFRMTFD